jgi:OmpA-OmpF porin, OOP family
VPEYPHAKRLASCRIVPRFPLLSGVPTPELPMLRKGLALAALLLCTNVCFADATEPTADVAGAKDVPWLKRYDGSFAVSYDAKAYDEFVLPLGPLEHKEGDTRRDPVRNNRIFDFANKLDAEGARTRIVYLIPAGRSPLEVLRNYEQEIVAAGGVKKFECKPEDCGGDPGRSSSGGGGDQSVAMKLWPEDKVTEPAFSNGACAQTAGLAQQRLASFEIPGKGYAVVHAYVHPGGPYCKAFEGRVIAVVDVLEQKAREQNMVTVSASDMQQAISTTGRVALYGIYFDTNSATIKPESKATLDEIGKLLANDVKLKLHVVGHTDNVGGLDSNMDLSKRRAAAVREALTAQYGVDAARLSANGVAYLAPVAANTDDTGRAKNRRVELVPF